MTSENAADRPAQGTETTSENTDGSGYSPFGAPAAPYGRRLSKSPMTTAALLDPFRVPSLIVDTDAQRSDSHLRDER